MINSHFVQIHQSAQQSGLEIQQRTSLYVAIVEQFTATTPQEYDNSASTTVCRACPLCLPARPDRGHIPPRRRLSMAPFHRRRRRCPGAAQLAAADDR